MAADETEADETATDAISTPPEERVERRRPFWLRVEEVWLGFTNGEWPIAAFGDPKQAAYWASEKPEARIVIGPVPVPDEIPCYRGEIVPAERVLKEY